ncbi:hypothetical protein [Burkholderia gladioli]|uniref:hypothetical protein n=2 Tax=Burkholderia TaxID=32008 RepID=UPI0011B1EF4E|nr:hypothetical protein [Burkholderia gladioli]MBU9170327.1 hypothetical protein [Burkholderia gladioli]MBU9180069.1 hypothetical protein [Burkholderia gladioli]MBU9218486.1 hypothetical protein [Burkholderia gladioli]MDN7728168.1 hypothetical protein [Burkholderia gladioli]MDN7806361.1 hypothetical protein [Burkholderia gladioli]
MNERAACLARLHQVLAHAIARDYVDAATVDRHADEIAGWYPRPSHCHTQVAAWLALHPNDAPLRGWATECTFGNAVRFAAHSLVRTADGEVIDVAFSRPHYPYRFIAHPPGAGDFLALVLGEPPLAYVDVLLPRLP